MAEEIVASKIKEGDGIYFDVDSNNESLIINILNSKLDSLS
ncbi:hypothetical protein CCAN2_1100001 [Capnocytophaga canimorsus]|nr:hypothetical protein CCAN2_1100001 [Capnocytophaga canimorsus]